MPRPLALALAAALAALLAAAPAARADDAEDESETHLTSYAGDIILVDLAAGALAASGTVLTLIGATPGTLLLGAGGILYAVGGPTVHARHGNAGKAAISLGTRIALPLLVAAYKGRNGCFDCSRDGAFDLFGETLALGTGAAAAMLVDWIALAWERRPDAVTPTVNVRPDGAVLALAGRW